MRGIFPITATLTLMPPALQQSRSIILCRMGVTGYHAGDLRNMISFEAGTRKSTQKIIMAITFEQCLYPIISVRKCLYGEREDWTGGWEAEASDALLRPKVTPSRQQPRSKVVLDTASMAREAVGEDTSARHGRVERSSHCSMPLVIRDALVHNLCQLSIVMVPRVEQRTKLVFLAEVPQCHC